MLTADMSLRATTRNPVLAWHWMPDQVRHDKRFVIASQNRIRHDKRASTVLN